MTSKRKYEVYCLSCLGGGKSLGVYTSRKLANQTATAHMNAYGCSVTVLTRCPDCCRDITCCPGHQKVES